MSSSPSQPSQPSQPSLYLRKLVQQQRDPSWIPPVPQVCPLSDDYLRNFLHTATAKRREWETTEAGDDSEEEWHDDDQATYANPNETKVADKYEKLFPVRLFNLPYTASVHDVEAWGILHLGVPFETTNLDSNHQGAATVTILLQNYASSAKELEEEKMALLRRLTERRLHGRVVRIQRKDVTKSYASRYFDARGGNGQVNISCKCNRCGSVGHTDRICTESTPLLCHLCAGQDHDAQNCVNIICFKCNAFGHHSRDCTVISFGGSGGGGRRRVINVICSSCGSTDHDFEYCIELRKEGLVSVDLDFDPHVVCMVCGEKGHAMCPGEVPIPVPDDGLIFCPACAQQGHFLDPRYCPGALLDEAGV